MATAAERKGGTFLCVHGIAGPRIRIDDMSEETRRSLFSIFAEHFQEQFGEAVCFLASFVKQGRPNDEAQKLASKTGVKVAFAQIAEDRRLWQIELTKGVPFGDINLLQEHLDVLGEVREKI